ncbi:gliding motility-associated C-terminal domain-containing protein [Flavobacterium kingsejongi]|uniref:Gliding motility-associated C-terminal domain-containing protein n=1 Tax=Flavobacterium kingsejongi TaxID=1678728 RepID=A0A2S1LL37_9FLAO|nr:gliding motility-associated C-terminal domain-containing protein [Flavobacterium kingsejongi]AWG24482.1 hypothetical protein FK004_04145 [Flavobacterium kingsejongi]
MKNIRTSCFSFLALLSYSAVQGQFYNTAQVVVQPGSLLSIHSDFENAATGTFRNDGEVHILQHYNNDGQVTFHPAHQGITVFSGNSVQTLMSIAPGAKTDFKHLELNNPTPVMAIDLWSPIQIFGTASFMRGIVDARTNAGLVTFGEDAAVTNADEDSFIDGPTVKVGSNDWTSPIGHQGHYRPAGHTQLAGSEQYRKQYFMENPGTLYPLSQKASDVYVINQNEYWEMHREVGNTMAVITLSLNPATTPSYLFEETPGTTLQIVRWNEDTQQWISQGGIGDSGLTEVSALVTGYGVFTIALVFEDDHESFDGMVFYNGVSPNGDGKNDFFHISGIERYPDNTLEIYNRYSQLVYRVDSYNETERVFKGISNTSLNVNKPAGLPVGTYFYVLKYNNGHRTKSKTGYLYISNK